MGQIGQMGHIVCLTLKSDLTHLTFMTNMTLMTDLTYMTSMTDLTFMTFMTDLTCMTDLTTMTYCILRHGKRPANQLGEKIGRETERV